MSSAEMGLAGDIESIRRVGVQRPESLPSEQLQRQHYDRIAAAYEAHYSDACSREYRRRFIYDPMFSGIDLSKMRVLDAM